MQYLGKIDMVKFEKISDKIITDEVILTDERIAHINYSRGKGFYERYGKYFSDVVSEPDIIFEDKKYTAILVKRIDDGVKYLNLILRLATPESGNDMKNSIITAIGIGDSRLKTYIKNKKAIYKRV
jgi:hypothetical protein